MMTAKVRMQPLLVCLFALIFITSLAFAQAPSSQMSTLFRQARKPPSQGLAPIGLLSLSSFIPNAGQMDAAVLYYGRGPGYTVYFAREQAVFAFVEPSSPPVQPVALTQPSIQGVNLALRFLGANPGVTLEGRQQGTGKVNYLAGNDAAKWHVGLPTYEQVVYRELWPGVDLVFRAAKRQPKHELVLHPGASVKAIRLAYRGAEGVAIDAGGNLRIRTALGVLTEERPRSYQEIDGRQVPVESRFVLRTSADGEGSYGFEVDSYDPSRPLIIDPAFFLVYSTYLGGGLTDVGTAIAVDGGGNAFVSGYTESSNFPKTTGPAFKGGTKSHGNFDAFVAKFNPAGSLQFATYLGGTDADFAYGIAVKPGCAADCNAYVTGVSYSRDFPTTTGAFGPTISGGVDAFVTKLKADGTLSLGTPSAPTDSYSTFFGGGGFDAGYAIAVDSGGNAYVTGETLSSNFPTTPFAVFANSQGGRDAFVTKFNANGTAPLVYSTYLGGNRDDMGLGIAVTSAGNAIVTGQTFSANFPTHATFPTRVTVSLPSPSFTSLAGTSDAFVARLSTSGSLLEYSSFLGGSGDDTGRGVAIDATGNAYVTGDTTSTNFPTTTGAFKTTSGGGRDAFVTKVNAAGNALVYSTYLGSSGDDVGRGITVDGLGGAHVVGDTTSPGAPTGAPPFSTPASFQPTNKGGRDVFITRLNVEGNSVTYSTFLGGSGNEFGRGIALNSSGEIHVTGDTASSNASMYKFPLVASAQGSFGGVTDAFVTKLGVDSDGDGIPDFADNCPIEPNPDQADRDGDGVGDACDNCPLVANSGQEPGTNPSLGAACDCQYSLALNTGPITTQQGQPIPINTTLTLTGSSGGGACAAGPQSIITIVPDCINTQFTFLAVDPTTNNVILPPLPPVTGERAYGFLDLFTLAAGPPGFTLNCDISRVVDVSHLTPGKYKFFATYGNYFDDGQSWIGAVSSNTADLEITGSPVTKVQIDIKPTSFPSSFNCKNADRTIDVALLSGEVYDPGAQQVRQFKPTDYIPGSVRFGKPGANGAAPIGTRVADVNGDGVADVVFDFRFGDTGFTCSDTLGQTTLDVIGVMTASDNVGPVVGADTMHLVGGP
jgi:hypothetical protein